MRRVGRPAVAGAAVGLAYLAVVFLTQLSGYRVRPLFEGIGPPPPYQWVNPPAEFAAGNRPPRGASQELELGPDGTDNASITTDDVQVIVSLVRGSIPPHPPDRTVTITVEPLDPAKLGALPANLAPDGNAYRITIVDQPSGTAVASVAPDKPGNIVLRAATDGQTLLRSSDGRSWSQLQGIALGGSSNVAATFTEAGIYLVARDPRRPRPRPGQSQASTTAPSSAAGNGGGGGGAQVGVIVAVVVVALVVLLIGLRRFRPPPRGGRPSRRR